MGYRWVLPFCAKHLQRSINFGMYTHGGRWSFHLLRPEFIEFKLAEIRTYQIVMLMLNIFCFNFFKRTTGRKRVAPSPFFLTSRWASTRHKWVTKVCSSRVVPHGSLHPISRRSGKRQITRVIAV